MTQSEDVTADVLSTLRWMVQDQLYRQHIDDYQAPQELKVAPSLSPEMHLAVDLLDRLSRGEITCVCHYR